MARFSYQGNSLIKLRLVVLALPHFDVNPVKVERKKKRETKEESLYRITFSL